MISASFHDCRMHVLMIVEKFVFFSLINWTKTHTNKERNKQTNIHKKPKHPPTLACTLDTFTYTLTHPTHKANKQKTTTARTRTTKSAIFKWLIGLRLFFSLFILLMPKIKSNVRFLICFFFFLNIDQSAVLLYKSDASCLKIQGILIPLDGAQLTIFLDNSQ